MCWNLAKTVKTFVCKVGHNIENIVRFDHLTLLHFLCKIQNLINLPNSRFCILTVRKKIQWIMFCLFSDFFYKPRAMLLFQSNTINPFEASVFFAVESKPFVWQKNQCLKRPLEQKIWKTESLSENSDKQIYQVSNVGILHKTKVGEKIYSLELIQNGQFLFADSMIFF